MKRILCYGDSNTWGFDPDTFAKELSYYLRYDENTRWTSLLQNRLGSGYTVIEEGLGGRTTVFDDPLNLQQLNGRQYLMPCLGSHAPIDLVVMMLGTNDLKTYFNVSAFDIAAGNELLVKIIQSTNFGPEGRVPQILLVSPVSLNENLSQSCIRDLFNVPYTIERCKILPGLIEGVAERNGCHYLFSDPYVELSTIDYVHFTKNGHMKLADAIAQKIKDCLNDQL